MDNSKFQIIHWYFDFHCIEIHFKQSLKFDWCFVWLSFTYLGSMILLILLVVFVLFLEAQYLCKELKHSHSVCRLLFYQHRYDNNLLYWIEFHTKIFGSQHIWASQRTINKRANNYLNVYLEYFWHQQQVFTNR